MTQTLTEAYRKTTQKLRVEIQKAGCGERKHKLGLKAKR